MNIKFLKERIAKLIQGFPISAMEFKIVEENLKIKLPHDFIELNSVKSYEFNTLFSFLNFGDIGENSVIKFTEEMWNFFGGDKNFIMLFNDGTSVILMHTNGNSNTIRVAVEDVENVLNGSILKYKHTIFPTFADFFEYLLDEEEKLREESV